MTFFLLYKWAILASMVMAPTLALVGCHLAARDKAMQTLCVGQGATLGVLLGLGVLHYAGAHDTVLHFGPLLFAALFASGTFESPGISKHSPCLTDSESLSKSVKPWGVFQVTPSPFKTNESCMALLSQR